MHLDIFTALAASSFVVLLLGAVFLAFWRWRPDSLWLGWWAGAYFAIGAASLFLALKPHWPTPAPLAFGACLFLLGIGLIWQGTRAFENLKPQIWALAALALGAPCLFLVSGIAGDVTARAAALSVPTSAGLILAAWEAWRGRGEGLESKRALAALLLVMAVLLAARVPLSSVASFPLGSGPTNDVLIAVLVGGLLLTTILLATLVISMGLERAEKRQHDLAVTDPLTGVLNRRGLDLAFANGQLPAGFALIVFDLDRFKLVNDSFGHAAGDSLIFAFALICREELRQVDHAVRLGGEEFALVLARTGEQAALAVAERIRLRYAQMVVPIEGGALAGTASGGVFCVPATGPVWLTAALAEGDRAMYRAKAAGRNRVFVAESPGRASRDFDERCVAPEARAASA